MQPLVSCIVATKDRKEFLLQSIKYFLNQTYPNKELVIVDDGHQPLVDQLPTQASIHYIQLDSPVNLGSKLNLGIEAAHGQIIQKWDDDDYYHPAFLETNVHHLLSQKAPGECILCYDRFLVFLAATRQLKITGSGWCAGSTLCFQRNLWRRKRFRPLNRAVDWYFLQDHSPRRCKISNPELHILVRHSQHTWQKLGSQSVDDYMRNLPDYNRTLAELIDEEDVQFYFNLGQQ